MKELPADEFSPLAISDQDVIEAMRAIPGYLDITPGDFKEIYQIAYVLAVKRLFNTLTAETIMTKPVLALGQGTALVEAAALLAEAQVSGAPVVGAGGKIVGVVSEKDFLREMGMGEKPSFMRIATHCLNNRGCMIGMLHHKTVADIMSRPPLTGTTEMSVGAVSALFAEKRINRLPIIDAQEHPVGIVTRTDLAYAFHTRERRSK